MLSEGVGAHRAIGGNAGERGRRRAGESWHARQSRARNALAIPLKAFSCGARRPGLKRRTAERYSPAGIVGTATVVVKLRLAGPTPTAFAVAGFLNRGRKRPTLTDKGAIPCGVADRKSVG